MKWNQEISYICIGLILMISCITFSSASIQFDKVEGEQRHEESPKKVSTRTLSLRLKQDQNQRSPLNRPRRDHQYATYKVPKNHVLVDYGWNPRQMSSFAQTNLLGPGPVGSQGPPPTEYYPAGIGGGGGGGGSDEDNVVAAGGHGHSQQGWGWGHSQGHKYKKSEVNSSAVGMLGFLGLLALVQNVLRQMNGGLGGGLGGGGGIGGGGGAGGGGGGGVVIGPGGGGGGVGGKRKKRSVEDRADADSQASMFPLYETTSAIVPYLLNLNQIREGERPLYCSSYLVCMLSKTASQGMTGEKEKYLIRNTLTSVIGEMLAPLAKPRTKEKADLRKLINWAATVGLKGENCDKHFKECKM